MRSFEKDVVGKVNFLNCKLMLVYNSHQNRHHPTQSGRVGIVLFDGVDKIFPFYCTVNFYPILKNTFLSDCQKVN